jgi:hypothetical protein
MVGRTHANLAGAGQPLILVARLNVQIELQNLHYSLFISIVTAPAPFKLNLIPATSHGKNIIPVDYRIGPAPISWTRFQAAVSRVTLVPFADSPQVESGGFDNPFVLTL